MSTPFQHSRGWNFVRNDYTKRSQQLANNQSPPSKPDASAHGKLSGFQCTKFGNSQSRSVLDHQMNLLAPAPTALNAGELFFKIANMYSGEYIFYKKLKNVSCEYDRLNVWNSNLQAAWYIRHVRIVWFLWTKPTIWLLILRFTQNIVRACFMLYPYGGYRSVTLLDVARVNRTIFHNHFVH